MEDIALWWPRNRRRLTTGVVASHARMSSRHTQKRDASQRIASATRSFVLLVVLALLTIYVLHRLTDISESLSVARGLAWPVLVLAIAIESLSYVSGADVLRSTVLLTGHRMTLLRATMIDVAGATLGLVAAGVVGY